MVSLNREDLQMPTRLACIGKIRDEGIFELKMLTPSLTKKVLPKAPVILAPVPRPMTASVHTVGEERQKIMITEERKKQYEILKQRREALEKEKQEKIKKEAEHLNKKAKQRIHPITKPRISNAWKGSFAKLTTNETKKLEKLVMYIEARTNVESVINPPSLLFQKLRNRFKKLTSKQVMLNRCLSGMAAKKELIYINGIPALTREGCVICGKPNVKVFLIFNKNKG